MKKHKQETLKKLAIEAFKELSYADRLRPMEIILPPSVLFYIVSSIQLTIRHPEVCQETKEISEQIARQMQELFNEDSAVYTLLNLGWNPAYDGCMIDRKDDSNSDYEPVTGDNEPLIAEDITDELSPEEYERIIALSEALKSAIPDRLNESDPDVTWEVVNLGELQNEER